MHHGREEGRDGAEHCEAVTKLDQEPADGGAVDVLHQSVGRSLEKRKRSSSVLGVSLHFGGTSGAVLEAGGGGGLRARERMRDGEQPQNSLFVRSIFFIP